MTDIEIENIEHLLKSYYGALKVVVDNDLLFVYGSDVDAVYTAVVVEYGGDYDIFYERRNDLLKEVVLRVVKNKQKVVDKLNQIQ
jgi:hypothetical protein